MPKKIDESIFDQLGDILDEEEEEQVDESKLEPWSPSLGPTQQKVFDCSARWVLVSGNRGSGKSYGAMHKAVRHLYEEENALVVVVVGVRSQATQGGVWDKIQLEVLPEWKENIGLNYTEEKRDEMTYRYIFVENRHGGWSKIVMVSFPWKEQVAPRIRGFEPSMIIVDELTTLGGPIYFDAIIQQLGRRPGIRGPQQYVATTNPDGPRHWVYKRFYEGPYGEAKDDEGNVISAKGEWDSRYAVFTLNVEENKHNLQKGYYEQILEATRNDPIEYRRMVLGEWVDRPDGDALFAEYFNNEVHVVKAKKGKRPCPLPRFPVVLGYDLGQTSNAITFSQPLLIKDRGLMWFLFDEIVLTNRRVPYDILVRALLRRMQTWEQTVRHSLKWYHVSDDSAFNQYRPGSNAGSYDHLQVKKYSEEFCAEYGQKPIRMVPAPKFQGSVEARVHLTSQLLREDRLLVSSACDKHIQMFNSLQSQKVKEGNYDPTAKAKPKRSVHLHPFDSMSYIFLESELGRPKFIPGRAGPKVEIVEKLPLQ